MTGYTGASAGKVTTVTSGPAAGKYGLLRASGGGHAGPGGAAATSAVIGYDSTYWPILSGSGGGSVKAVSGGRGGGTVRIRTAGDLSVDGVISASGEDCLGFGAGAGAGGSIILEVNGTLSGGGNISANGGSSCSKGYGGAGAGGRIALIYGRSAFSGVAQAKAGRQNDTTLVTPAVGTVYTRSPPSSPYSVESLAVISDGTIAKGVTWFSEPGTYRRLKSLTVAKGASVEIVSTNVSIDAITAGGSTALATRILLTGNSFLNCSTAKLQIIGMELYVDKATVINLHNLTIGASGAVVFSQNSNTLPTFSIITPVAFDTLTGPILYFRSLVISTGGNMTLGYIGVGSTNSFNLVAGTLAISKLGRLAADGLGFPGLTGCNSTRSNRHTGTSCTGQDLTGGAGGGHSGQGGDASRNSGGGTYRGSAFFPMGSGGGGGAGPLGAGGGGGGGLRVIVLTSFKLDGILSANGAAPGKGSSAGGGAGGSIWVDIGQAFTGSGSIIANGGRIPVAYNVLQSGRTLK